MNQASVHRARVRTLLHIREVPGSDFDMDMAIETEVLS